MSEPTTAVKEKLAQATARRAAELTTRIPAAPAPVTPKQPTVLAAAVSTPTGSAATPDGSPAAGNGTATYLLLDHYFGGTAGTFWTYDGTTWRAASTGEPSDEQGLAQVTFAANRVDMWWNDTDQVTIVRAWKYL